jgi:hypothetical protein
MGVKEHAAEIRSDMARLGKDPAVSRRYAMVAARWDWLRLLRDRGDSAPGDDMRFAELTNVLRGLSEQLQLDVATEGHCGPDAVIGVTVPWGPWLPGDCGYLIHG